jgi:hypothetical protein
MRLLRVQALGSLFLAAILCAPAWASNPGARQALPGTVNYVEGQASTNGESLDSKSIGQTTLRTGQAVSTEKGNVEILLTPGVFLRAGNETAVQLVSASLTDTEVRIVQGHAMVEVAQIFPQNDIRVQQGNATTRLLKPGLYDFDMDQNQVRVFDGKATVQEGDKTVTVKKDREVNVVSAAPSKPQKFNAKAYDSDDLYRWSSLRSAYLAEANIDAGRVVVTNGWGPGWWGPGFGGWFWDPWFSAFTFVPGGGIFYSPFGWGFYSPVFVGRAPIIVRPVPHTFSAVAVTKWGPGAHYAASNRYVHGIYTGRGASRGFIHSGRMMSGGRATGAASFHGGSARGGQRMR